MSMPQKVSQTRYARRRLVIASVGALAVGLLPAPSAAQVSAVSAGAAAVTADSGTWIQISGMTRARSHHFAAVLSDGRVLVINGGTAEIYDRKTDRWREPRLPNSRHGFRSTAATLIDGRLLMIGGSSRDGVRPYGAFGEIYDPARNTWAKTSPLNVPRVGDATATLLPDGRVLVVGGRIDDGARLTTATSRAEIYDPAADTWTEVSDSGQTRYDHGTVLLRDGTVLVAGGFKNGANISQIFDPAPGDWSPTASLNSLSFNNAFLLPDGTVLFGNEIYDPATRTWTPNQPIVRPELSGPAYRWHGTGHRRHGCQGDSHL